MGRCGRLACQTHVTPYLLQCCNTPIQSNCLAHNSLPLVWGLIRSLVSDSWSRRILVASAASFTNDQLALNDQLTSWRFDCIATAALAMRRRRRRHEAVAQFLQSLSQPCKCCGWSGAIRAAVPWRCHPNDSLGEVIIDQRVCKDTSTLGGQGFRSVPAAFADLRLVPCHAARLLLPTHHSSPPGAMSARPTSPELRCAGDVAPADRAMDQS
eukprot:362344-Chlamydomonas_euryale.AAC.2